MEKSKFKKPILKKGNRLLAPLLRLLAHEAKKGEVRSRGIVYEVAKGEVMTRGFAHEARGAKCVTSTLGKLVQRELHTKFNSPDNHSTSPGFIVIMMISGLNFIWPILGNAQVHQKSAGSMIY